MRQALYRKYRSRKFDEVVGQEHVTKTLQSAIKSGRISHAYLFTGPRGVGKTSVARILAHEVNRLPYEGEAVHLDIIEIDAASNRRIDEIRDLRERVRIAPASAKYKVYIIDEVHMLTREAFNALLKTLEEPPAHVIFILATTEAHKLPETIISRTQRFEFKPIGPSEAARHLGDIAKREKITIDREAVDMLAEFGSGSFRDSISYLDQLSSLPGKITAADVRQALGLPSKQEISKLLETIVAGDLKAVMAGLQAVRDQGVDAATTAAALAAQLRQMAADGQAGRHLITLLKQLLEIPASQRPHDLLEIAVLEAAQPSQPTVAAQDTSQPERGKMVPAASPMSSDAALKPKKPASELQSGQFALSQWPEVIEKAKTKAASIYTSLRLAEPELDGKNLILKFQFPLHQKKIDQAKSKELVAAIIQEISGQNLSIRCEVDKEAFIKEIAPDSNLAVEDNAGLSSINNIFGGAEVLES